MTTQMQRVYEMLIRVGDFRRAHRALIPNGSLADQVFDRVDAAVAAVEKAHADLISGRGKLRESTSVAGNARRAVRKRSDAIILTSRAISLAPGAPKLLRARLRRCSDTEFASDALSLADVVAPHARLFVRHGMTSDFVDRLRKEATALRESATARGVRRAKIAGLRVRLSGTVRAGFNAVRQLEGSS